MKLMHLSDLHLGLWLHRWSLQEEQTEVLERIRQIASEERPDAVLIAGDVFDRAIPPEYALTMFDTFLRGLLAMGLPVFISSGNHDSAERLGFLSAAMKDSGLHISPAYTGRVEPVSLRDESGLVHVWMLPYLKPALVKRFFPEEPIESTHDAVRAAIRYLPLDRSVRNVLLCHQFVAGAAPGGSEESLQYTSDISVGGSDLVDAGVFEGFDYVALGHIHRSQQLGERIRYCGTPMAYSYAEAGQEKSVTIAEMDGDGSVSVYTVPIPAPRRLQEVRGAYEELTSLEHLRQADRDAYTHVILTSDAAAVNIMDGLKQVYPRLTHVDWDTPRTRRETEVALGEHREQMTPLHLFEEFYRQMGGGDLTAGQLDHLRHAIGMIWGNGGDAP